MQSIAPFPKSGWHGSVFAAMLTVQDMAAETGCHATQNGFLSRTAGKAGD
jgi:hypothetical protein